MEQEENILGKEKIGKLIRKFSIPCIISMLVNSLYNIVDQIFIGQGVGYLGNGAECANYPFCTIEPNVGVVAVPDERLDNLAKLYNTQKVTPAIIEFVDIAGIVKGASHGEGLGNKFLSHIREVDAIVHVVRCFDDSKIIHVNNKIDPVDDMKTINLELILADLESVQNKIAKAEKQARANDKQAQEELALLLRCKECLENEQSLRTLELDENESQIMKSFFLLTSKPVIYAANISENDIANENDNQYVKLVKEQAQKEGAEVIVLSAKIEEEISKLSAEEKQMFYEDLGIKHSGLDNLIKASYKLLGLISFLTAGEKEVRAWTIKNGTKAPQAAGKIHTDFERGFIKAEVCDYHDLLELGGYVKAKEKGKVRMEGKDYVVKDGDVMLFKFNV